ncbi:hypothetical protein M3O96_14515 [Aquiflexum sp. TKW24L]|nr:hypothetical protein [Aquiflexum sp. TKW24L]
MENGLRLLGMIILKMVLSLLLLNKGTPLKRKQVRQDNLIIIKKSFKIMKIDSNHLFTIRAIIWVGMGFIMGFSCLSEEKEYLTVDFEIPITVSPVKEAYHIGDTIHVEVEFHKELTSFNQDFTYSFEDFNFFAWIRCTQLLDKTKDQPDQPGGLGGFNIVNTKGGLFPFSSAGAEMNYIFENDMYVMKTSLILRRPGIYSISFHTNNGAYNFEFQKQLDVPGKVVKIGNLVYKVNNGIGGNNHLIFENTINKWEEDPDKFGWNSLFSFKVVE